MAALIYPLVARAIFAEKETPLIHSSSPEGVALVAPQGIIDRSDTSDFQLTTQAAPGTSGVRAYTPPQGSNLTVEASEMRELVKSYFPENPVMWRIIEAESQFNPRAQNPNSTAAGLAQILVGTFSAYGCTGDRYDPHDNLRCAKIIYEKDGTRPWNASKSVWGVE